MKVINLEQGIRNSEHNLYSLLGIRFETYDPNPFTQSRRPKDRRGNRVILNTGDCTIRALTKISGKTYDEIYAMLAKEGARRHQMMNGTDTIGYVCKEFGYSIYRFSSSDFIPFGTFMSVYKRGKFVLMSRDHAFAYCDGVIYDLKSMYYADMGLLGAPLKGILAVRITIADINDRLFSERM